MSTVDITAPSVLRGVPKDLREHIKGAALLGWTGRKRGGGGLILYSPDGQHTVNIPITVNRVNTVKGIARDIVRYTPDDVKAAVTDEAIEGQHDKDVVALASLVRDAQGVFPPSMVAHLEPEAAPEVGVPEPEPAVTIVDTKPWLARVSSNGVTADLYESQAVIERTRSDGSVDYMCAYCTTDFVSDKPRSVSSHYAVHTKAGLTPRTTQEATVFDAKIDGYRTVRVAHLAKEIEAALLEVDLQGVEDGSELPASVMARRLAEHIVKERIARGKEKAEEEPVPSEPEDILARIRTMLLRDEHKQIEVAQKQAENLRAQIAEAEAERDRYKAQSEKRGQALQAFAAMAAEEVAD